MSPAREIRARKVVKHKGGNMSEIAETTVRRQRRRCGKVLNRLVSWRWIICQELDAILDSETNNILREWIGHTDITLESLDRRRVELDRRYLSGVAHELPSPLPYLFRLRAANKRAKAVMVRQPDEASTHKSHA